MDGDLKDFDFVSLDSKLSESLFSKYFGQNFVVGSKAFFVREFSSILTSSVRLVKRQYSYYRSKEGVYFLVRVSYSYDGVIRSGVGCHSAFRKARDMSYYNLINRFLEDIPEITMPKKLVVLPNWQGHCFLNSALIPLFHSVRFVHQLFRSHLNVSSLVGVGQAVNAIKAKNIVGDEEKRYLWIYAMFEFYRELFKASLVNNFQIHNYPPLLKLKMEPNAPYEAPEKLKPTNDLELNDQQTHLLRHLSQFCAPRYRTPGGCEDVVCRDILRKLANDDKQFHSRFLFTVNGDFVCRYCPNVTTNFSYSFPVLYLPGDACSKFHEVKISDLLLRVYYWRESVNVTCPRIVNGSVCGGPYRAIKNLTVTKLPELLLISLKGPLMEDKDFSVVMEDTMTISFEDKLLKYNRFAFSSVYRVWIDCFDRPISDRYLVQEDGYYPDGWHTCLQMKTVDGYVEVNNGEIYDPIPELLENYTEGSLVFYELENSSSWLLTVDCPIGILFKLR